MDHDTKKYQNERRNTMTIYHPQKWCADCRDGEHSNIDTFIELVRVSDPDTGKMVKRAYLCESHRQMYLDDGYTVRQA